MNMLRKGEAEGGCGVIGLACEEKVAGKHLLSALDQMRNRGNGKGGGIAAVGLSPEAFGVTPEVLANDYILAIAYLDRKCQTELEKAFIHPLFEVDHVYEVPHLKFLNGLEVTPPEAVLYFVRVKFEAIQAFIEKHQLKDTVKHAIEDEIVYQNSYRLNQAFYSAAGNKRAFVLSQAKNLLVLKMVGFGDDVIRYYQIENFKAHVWIGHHRYPTKGKVWHPGGAHPFVGLHEALVHNGDFANYSSICEYLAQRHIYPHFLTDTEVAALLFDLWHRTYKYPLEYVMEALAPTTERDFTLLPKDKQDIYQMLLKTHINGSPDGPWFFLVAQSLKSTYSLIGITDTSMLRPQVFALQKGSAAIGFAASEKQAIDASCRSLSEEDSRFWPQADFYWNARGGSHTDGGAFIFTVHPQSNGSAKLICTDKFGQPIHDQSLNPPYQKGTVKSKIEFPDLPAEKLFQWIVKEMANWDYQEVEGFLEVLVTQATDDHKRKRAFEVLTFLLDHQYPIGKMRRSSLHSLFNRSIVKLADLICSNPSNAYVHMKFKDDLPTSTSHKQTAIIEAGDYPAQGPDSLAIQIVELYKKGVKSFILINCRGQRFIGNGLGPRSDEVRLDVYGSSGDYLASGIDGAKLYVHGSGQDQLGQIMNAGTLVVYGDIGQTFMYGAKGGKAFIRGNAAGRPMINAVGHPRVVINGTCLDYLAESFMAGNPLKEGGFVILNGITFDLEGSIVDLDTPYPGNNLFSLASGGAIYIRDPLQMVVEDQLNGGEIANLTQADWDLILPYLEENERLFHIPVSRLLEHRGKSLSFQTAYRKIIPARVRALQEEEAWVKKE